METAKIIDFKDVNVNVSLSEKAEEMAQEASNVLVTYQNSKIANNDQYTKAGEVLKEIKTRIKALDEERKSMTKPIDESKSRIMNFFRKPIGWLQDAESAIKRAMLSFQQEQDRIRREQERKLAQEASEREEREKKRLEARALKADEKGQEAKAEALREQKEEVQHQAPILPDRVEKVQGISTKKIWKFEITDQNQIPREYMIPDLKTIGAIVRATKGAKPIAGIHIFSEDTIAAGRG